MACVDAFVADLRPGWHVPMLSGYKDKALSPERLYRTRQRMPESGSATVQRTKILGVYIIPGPARENDMEVVPVDLGRAAASGRAYI